MGFYKWRTDAIPTEDIFFTGNNFKYNLVNTLHTKSYERLYGRGSYNFNALALIKDFNGYRQIRFGCDQIPTSSSYGGWTRESHTTKNYYKIIYSDVELPTDYFTPLTTINRVVGTYLLKPIVTITEDFIASEVSFIKNLSGSVSERLFYNIYTDNGNIYGVYGSEFWSTGSGSSVSHKSLPSYGFNEYRYISGSHSAGEIIYSAEGGWQNGYTGEIRFSSVIPIMKVFQDFIDNNSYKRNTNINILYNDNVLGSLTNLYPISKANLYSQNNTYKLVLYDILNNSSEVSFDAPIIKNYTFRGLGLTPRTLDILPDVETEIDLHGDVELFLIYQKYRPVTEKFYIELYQNSAEVNRVDKTLHIVNVGSLSGALRDECSIIRPSIIIAQDSLPTFNYVYIPIFSRYYFVTGITSVNFGLWRIELNTDVLMTYQTGVKALTAIIARQENDYNDNLIDTEIPTEKEPTITYQEIPNTVLNTQEGSDKHSFVVTVVGN